LFPLKATIVYNIPIIETSSTGSAYDFIITPILGYFQWDVPIVPLKFIFGRPYAEKILNRG